MPGPVPPAAPGQRGPDLCFKQLRGKSLFSAMGWGGVGGKEVRLALPRLSRGPAHPPLGGSRARAAAARGRRVFAARRGLLTGAELLGCRERCLGWVPAPPASSRPHCGHTPLGGTEGSQQHRRSPPTCPSAAASALRMSQGARLHWLRGEAGRRGAGEAPRGGRSGARPRDKRRPVYMGPTRVDPEFPQFARCCAAAVAASARHPPSRREGVGTVSDLKQTALSYLVVAFPNPPRRAGSFGPSCISDHYRI